MNLYIGSLDSAAHTRFRQAFKEIAKSQKCYAVTPGNISVISATCTQERETYTQGKYRLTFMWINKESDYMLITKMESVSPVAILSSYLSIGSDYEVIRCINA